MKVLYFHQHFSTPKGSTGIRSYEMATRLIKHGHSVTMVCGSYGGGETGLTGQFIKGRREGSVDGIDIIEFDLAYSNKDGFVKRGWLGVSVQEVTKDLADSFGLDVPRGALIGSVLTDSPAESSGLKDGDVIVDFDGNEIIYSGDLPMVVGRISPGEEVKATVYRDGRKKSIRVTVGELEEPEEDSNPIASAPKNNRLGMVVEDFEDIAERRNTDVEKIKENFGVKEGVVVSRVVSGPAFDAGLRRGDVITRIGMTDVSSKTEYENALEDLNNETVIPLRFVRNKNGAFVTIKIKK